MSTYSIAPGRLAPAVAALAVVAALLAVAQPALALSSYDNVNQLAVSNFVDAGVAISTEFFDPEAVEAVVLATDANFPDGLTASAVAGAVGGPVLFTAPDALSAATRAEIDRLLAGQGTVYLMGGQAAISQAVADELTGAGYTVQRLEGQSRTETAVAAAELVGLPPSGQVIIARAFGPDGANTESDRATGWVDAVSCGAFAASQGVPILLTQTEVLTASTRAALESLDPTSATICGGAAAVAESVADEIRALGITVDRVEGPTRVETAIDAAQSLFGQATAAGATFSVVNGYGPNFGYGLAAAPLGNPILLVGTNEPTSCTDGSQPSRETLCYLGTAGDDEETRANIVLVGDESLVADDVANAAGENGGGVETGDLAPLAAPAGLDVDDNIDDDGTRLFVDWDAVADPDEILAGYNVYVGETKQGTGDTTVDAETTEFEVTGLTKDQEVSITVTAVDEMDRESEPSAVEKGTPKDEVPGAIENFDADPGNAKVDLSWNVGPQDFKSYIIERSAATVTGTCPGNSYAPVGQPITNRTTTTLTDNDVTNDTTYCYRIRVTDQANQTSPNVNSEPATPGTGPPVVTIDSPQGDDDTTPLFDGDSVYFGEPLVVEFRVTDPDTENADLRQSWAISYNGDAGPFVRVGAANQPITFTPNTNSGAATFSIPSCTTIADPAGAGDTTSGTVVGQACIRDEAQQDFRIRVTVTDGAVNGTDTARTGDLAIVRTPGPVQGLVAAPGPGRVTLGWERLNNITVADYVVYRASQNVQPGSDAGPEVCPDPTLQAGSYDTPEGVTPVPQTPPGTNPSNVGGGTVTNGTTVGGQQVNDVVYCYFVRARRGTTPGPRSDISAANPAAGLVGSVAITDPPNGGTIPVGERRTLKYKITAEQAGLTVQSITLSYCLDYRPEDLDPTGRPVCRDNVGRTFTAVPNGQVNLPTAIGDNVGYWDVPANVSQPGSAEDGGALQMVVEFSDGSDSPPGRVTRIFWS